MSWYIGVGFSVKPYFGEVGQILHGKIILIYTQCTLIEIYIYISQLHGLWGSFGFLISCLQAGVLPYECMYPKSTLN